MWTYLLILIHKKCRTKEEFNSEWMGEEMNKQLEMGKPKTSWLFWWSLFIQGIFQEIFEGEILIITRPTTLLQIFFEFSYYSLVIFESVPKADDTIQEPLRAWLGWEIKEGTTARLASAGNTNRDGY